MGIVRPVMDEYPCAWVFFVPFIVITSFAVINLFIGVIVDTMQTQHEQEAAEVEEHVHADAATLRGEIALLRGEVTALREALSSPSGGALCGGSPN